MAQHYERAPRHRRSGIIAAVSSAVAVGMTAAALMVGSAAAEPASDSVMAQVGVVPNAAVAEAAAIEHAMVQPRPHAPSGSAEAGGTADGVAFNVKVSPAKNLPATSAHITVSGTGFVDLPNMWVAVCQSDGAAPRSLARCLGGAIPSMNATSAWAVITANGSAGYAGPVSATWQPDGSFSLTLQIPVAAGQDADCLAGDCAVYVRAADDAVQSFDLQIPVTFEAPPEPSTETSTPEPSTSEDTRSVPTTVEPDSIEQDSVEQGAEQTVAFSGFEPGEKVTVTLYSDPVALPAEKADDDGDVTVTFTVPEDLTLGRHLLEVIGEESARVGLAEFSVTAPQAETTEESTESERVSTSAQSTEPTEVSTSDLLTTEQTVPETEESGANSGEDLAGGTDGDAASDEGLADDESEPSTGRNTALIWLLIVLAVLVIGAGVAAVLVVLRRKRAAEEGHYLGDGGGPEPDGAFGAQGQYGAAGEGEYGAAGQYGAAGEGQYAYGPEGHHGASAGQYGDERAFGSAAPDSGDMHYGTERMYGSEGGYGVSLLSGGQYGDGPSGDAAMQPPSSADAGLDYREPSIYGKDPDLDAPTEEFTLPPDTPRYTEPPTSPYTRPEVAPYAAPGAAPPDAGATESNAAPYADPQQPRYTEPLTDPDERRRGRHRGED